MIKPADFALRSHPSMEIRSTPTFSMTTSAGQRAPTGGPAAGGFNQALGDALKRVSESQGAASDLQRRFQTGDSQVTLEATMVAMQKAQIDFQAALTVRNRLVSAYTDIMNMQV